MKSSSYWRERTLQSKARTLRQAEREIAALDRDLLRAARELREGAARILQTLLDDPAAARQRLTGRQRRVTLQDYYRLVKAALGGDARADELLNLAEKRRKLSRLDALLLEVDGYTAKFYAAAHGRAENLLRLTADNAYYRQVFGFEQGLGRYEFTRLNPRALQALLREDWSGQPWSDRLWGHVRALDRGFKSALRQAALQGQGLRQMQSGIRRLTGQTRANVRRLVRTEAAHAAEQAARLAYEDAGVERYEFSATLDLKTSPACRALDGKTFPVAQARVGVNYPPMHPNCRSTTLPVVEGLEGVRESRAARNPTTGARETVPASWNYATWYKERVEKPTRFTQKKAKPVAPSMSERVFCRMVERLQSQGIAVIRDQEGDRLLTALGAEAMTFDDGRTILFQSGAVPNASAVFEEAIHSAQLRRGSNVQRLQESRELTWLELEIEAQHKLLRYARQYGITETEVQQIRDNLRYYQQMLEKKQHG